MPDAPWLHGSVGEVSCARVFLLIALRSAQCNIVFLGCSVIPCNPVQPSSKRIPYNEPQKRQQLRAKDLWRATEAWPCREVVGQPSHGSYCNGAHRIWIESCESVWGILDPPTALESGPATSQHWGWPPAVAGLVCVTSSAFGTSMRAWYGSQNLKPSGRAEVKGEEAQPWRPRWFVFEGFWQLNSLMACRGPSEDTTAFISARYCRTRIAFLARLCRQNNTKHFCWGVGNRHHRLCISYHIIQQCMIICVALCGPVQMCIG